MFANKQQTVECIKSNLFKAIDTFQKKEYLHTPGINI